MPPSAGITNDGSVASAGTDDSSKRDSTPGDSPVACHDIDAVDTFDIGGGCAVTLVDGVAVSTGSRVTIGVASTLPAASTAVMTTVCTPSDVTLTATDGPLMRPAPTATPSTDTDSPPLTSDDAAVNTSVDVFVADIESSGT
jgi:hypothetical protein